MSRAVAAALTAATALAAASASGDCSRRFPEPDYPSFGAFLSKFGLAYSGDERKAREATYQQTLRTIKAHNAQPSKSSYLTVNRFAVMSATEMSAMFGLAYPPGGRSRGPVAMRQGSRALNGTEDSPVSLDWRDHRPIVVTAVKEQSKPIEERECGSCWAFAAIAALESRIAIKTGVLFALSPQQLVSCAPNPNACGGTGGCDGSTAELAYDYLKGVGITTEWAYPWISGLNSLTNECQPHQITPKVASISGHVNVEPNAAAPLLQALLSGPVAVSVAASMWGLYGGGVFTQDECDYMINHVVVLMGYGEDCGKGYWNLRNSWGATWGEVGYIRLERAAVPAEEKCGWDTNPTAGDACAKPADNATTPEKVWVCGTCGVLAYPTYPVGMKLGEPLLPSDPAIGEAAAAPQLGQVEAHDFAGGLPEGAGGTAFFQTRGRRVVGAPRAGLEL